MLIRFVILAEFAFVALVLIMLVTQIAWPIITRRPLFPILRRPLREAERAIAAANEARDLEAMQQETLWQTNAANPHAQWAPPPPPRKPAIRKTQPNPRSE